VRVDVPTEERDEMPPTPSLRVSLRGHSHERMRLQRRPVLTAHALLLGAASTSNGDIFGLRRQLVSALGPSGVAAYRVLTGPEGSSYPDSMLPDIADLPGWHRYAADAVGDVDSASLGEFLSTIYDEPPQRWRSVLDNPKPWIHSMAAAMRRAGPIIDVLWRRAAIRLDIEEARFTTAAESGAIEVFYNTLSPAATMTDGELRVAWGREIFIEFPGDVILAPLLAPPGTQLLLDRGRDICNAYALSSTAEIWGDHEPVGRLQALLGPLRAELLLALQSPVTMGELAGRLGCPPSTLSHHAGKLASTGLVATVRLGKQIWIGRTEQGNRIVELLWD